MKIFVFLLVCVCFFNISSHRLYGKKRIIGGKLSTPNARAYMACIGFRSNHCERTDCILDYKAFCGGTILHRQWILTAAHCFRLLTAEALGIYKTDEIVVKVGSTKKLIDGGEWIPVETVVFPVGVNLPMHDIALLRLKRPIQMKNIKILVPPRPNALPRLGLTGTVAGWGIKDQADYTTSVDLKEIRMHVISETECLQEWNQIIRHHRICLMSHERNARSGTCDGDSGGGFVVNNVVIGVLSYGNSECDRGYSEVYTQVAHYANWIHKILNNFQPLKCKHLNHFGAANICEI